MIWKYKLEKDGLMYKILSFLSLISLVCSMFRNEERVIFIAIMLSCILLDFQSIKLLFLKTFLFKRFFNHNWYGCLCIWILIKLLSLKTFLLKRFVNHNWYGCLAFEFQSSYFLWKLFFLRDLSTIIDMVVLYLNFNQVVFFENFSS